eukprot:g49.t1
MSKHRICVGGLLLAALGGCAALGDCGVQGSQCFHNAANHYATHQLDDPAKCCAVCLADAKCASYTHWYSGGEQVCYLFRTTTTLIPGNCTSGTAPGHGPPAPAPAPAPGKPCSGAGCFPPPAHGPVCKDCPNIIFSLTDDQDIELGGWDPMVQTRELLGPESGRGAMLTNWRIHTPICSPSRSETVSGRYFHNIKSSLAVPPPTLQPAASGHIDSSLYANASFGVHLRARKGYQVGMFGKSNFNTYEGFDRWFQGAFLGNGGKWEDNEAPGFHYQAAKDEYATALLGNKTIEWLRRDNVTGAASGGRPFFAYFAPHCPHTPAAPADWYADACEGVASPRNPSYNHTGPGFLELVAKQPPLTDDDARLIDELARRRCQCLLSVDDAHAQIVAALKQLGKFDTTFFIVSSDHGYNLGHHRIPSNKFLLYDHALRIPGLVSGPGIAAGNNSVLGTNVDYAPTWLGMAGIETPPDMDGRSLLPQLVRAGDTAAEAALPAPTRRHLRAERARQAAGRPWRTEQFVQYYNQGGPSPFDGKPPGPWDAQGWAPGSSSNPKQSPSDLQFPVFPDTHSLHATVRPLDDYSNTYIGLYSEDAAVSGAGGRWKYGEFQYVCNSTSIALKRCFDRPDHYELFDLNADPYELENVYDTADPKVKAALATRLREYYACEGKACP